MCLSLRHSEACGEAQPRTIVGREPSLLGNGRLQPVRLAACLPRRRPASLRLPPRLSRSVVGRRRGSSRDAALAVATGFAIQAVLVVTGPLLARMLGPDGRGYLAALILWPIVITQLGNLGIPSALTYSIARDSSASRALARLGLAFALPQALLLIVFQALWLLLILHGDPTRGPGGGMADPGSRPGDARPAVRPWAAAGPSRLRLFNGLRLLPWALYAIGVATLFVAGDHAIEPIVGALVAAFLISGTACLLCGLRFSRGDGPRFRRPAVSPLLRAARPAVEPLGRRRAAARPGRAGAVPLARRRWASTSSAWRSRTCRTSSPRASD